jgi:tRNA dimethylallyltransferase
MQKKQVIIISGPTASGKSDFAVQLAKQIGGEIINADIGSLYTPLSIGTAKPDWQHQSIPHHLFDILDKAENFTVVQFRKQLSILIEEIFKRNNIPIIVGGSCFYIQSFFFKQHEITNTAQKIEQLEHDIAFAKKTKEQLWQELYEIDPVRAGNINPNDAYRLIRALAIFYATQQKPSEFEPLYKPLAPFLFLVCMRDREELYERINKRVYTMMEHGWLEEVSSLQNSAWHDFLMKKKLIGYDDLLWYLQGGKEQNFEQTMVKIAQKTRHYAKRQIIFLKRLQKRIEKVRQQCLIDGSIEEINLTLCDVGLYIKGLSNRILQNLK